MTININRDTLDRVIPELLEEFGEDYVYPHWRVSCVYVRDEAPSCIVGHVLQRVGVPLEALKFLDARPSTVSGLPPLGTEARDVDLWLNEFGVDIEITHEARRMLQRIQFSQDHGKAWGDAWARVNTLEEE